VTGFRRLSAWLVVVPLMLAGTEVAHAIAYRIVYPEAAVRWRVLAETGHGYLGYAPVCFGIAGALMLVGLAAGAGDVVRGRGAGKVPPWAFGLLPLAGFTLQEFLERWLANGGFPWWMVEQPTFRIGLALQLPFAVAAYVLARLLLRAADLAVLALRGVAVSFTTFGDCRSWQPLTAATVQLPVLAAGHAGRGPPVARVS